jgi:hypothetical protein
MPFFLVHQPVILAVAFVVVQWHAGIAAKLAAVLAGSLVMSCHSRSHSAGSRMSRFSSGSSSAEPFLHPPGRGCTAGRSAYDRQDGRPWGTARVGAL